MTRCDNGDQRFARHALHLQSVGGGAADARKEGEIQLVAAQPLCQVDAELYAHRKLDEWMALMEGRWRSVQGPRCSV